LTAVGLRWSNFDVQVAIIKFLKEWWGQWRAFLAEFLATLIFVFVASCAVLSNQIYGQIGIVGVALAIGFSYGALVFASSHLSGGFLNPALTLALWLAGRMSHAKTVTLIFVQVAASFAAIGLISLVFGSGASRLFYGAPTLGVGVDAANALGLEAILVAALVFVLFACAVDRGGPVSFSALALGLFVTGATLVALPISGAGLNPVRAIGPLVLSKSYGSLAVWLVGPLAGSLISILYEFAFLRRGKK
jgi:glycerol uptake facilitator-like aquaporin